MDNPSVEHVADSRFSKENLQLKKLYLYEKKEKKITSKEKIEIDSEDLESFSFTHVKEYLEIPSKMINGKSVLDWFSLKNI